MQNEEEIFTKVVDIVKPYVKDASILDTVQKTTHLLEDLGVNSSRVVDIILALEDEFDIEIADDEATEGVGTLGDITNLLKSKLN